MGGSSSSNQSTKNIYNTTDLSGAGDGPRVAAGRGANVTVTQTDHGAVKQGNRTARAALNSNTKVAGKAIDASTKDLALSFDFANAAGTRAAKLQSQAMGQVTSLSGQTANYFRQASQSTRKTLADIAKNVNSQGAARFQKTILIVSAVAIGGVVLAVFAGGRK